MSQLDEIKEKLKKLISKEESARQLGNLAEAEAFASKIQELLLKYALDIEELKAANQNKATAQINQEVVQLEPLMGNHEGDWIFLLYATGATYNFCRCLFPPRQSMNYVRLIGEDVHREFVHYFVHQLLSRVRELARRSFKEYQGPDKRNTYIRSFLKGAVHGIAAKLRDEREAARRAQPQVNALVLNKDAGLNIYMANNFGRLGTKKSNAPASQAGYASGFRTGNNLNVHKGVSSNRGMGGTKLIN